VTLENGVIIGADGFGFAKNEQGHWEKIPQSGPVRLGNRVDVQANACIDRATVGETRIGDGTKVDNLVQVGHGSHVGENTLLCATGGAGRLVGGGQQRHSGRAGGRGRPLHGGRRGDSDRADRHLARYSGGQGHLRLAGLRQPRLAAGGDHLPAAAGAAEAAGPGGKEAGGSGPAEGTTTGARNEDSSWHFGCRAAALVVATGCHSYHVETTVENRTGGPIQLLEVDYPSASFGANSLAAGAVLPLSHPVARQRAAQGAVHGERRAADQVEGPTLAERQEGRIEIVLLPGGKSGVSSRGRRRQDKVIPICIDTIESTGPLYSKVIGINSKKTPFGCSLPESLR
jgi:hypothetical protein